MDRAGPGGEFDARGNLAWVGGDPTWPGGYVQRGGDVRVTDVNSDSARRSSWAGSRLRVESGGPRVQC